MSISLRLDYFKTYLSNRSAILSLVSSNQLKYFLGTPFGEMLSHIRTQLENFVID